MGDKEVRLNRQLDAARKKLERAEEQGVKGYRKVITRYIVTFCRFTRIRERQSNTMEGGSYVVSLIRTMEGA